MTILLPSKEICSYCIFLHPNHLVSVNGLIFSITAPLNGLDMISFMAKTSERLDAAVLPVEPNSKGFKPPTIFAVLLKLRKSAAPLIVLILSKTPLISA